MQREKRTSKEEVKNKPYLFDACSLILCLLVSFDVVVVAAFFNFFRCKVSSSLSSRTCLFILCVLEMCMRVLVCVCVRGTLLFPSTLSFSFGAAVSCLGRPIYGVNCNVYH